MIENASALCTQYGLVGHVLLLFLAVVTLAVTPEHLDHLSCCGFCRLICHMSNCWWNHWFCPRRSSTSTCLNSSLSTSTQRRPSPLAPLPSVSSLPQSQCLVLTTDAQVKLLHINSWLQLC